MDPKRPRINPMRPHINPALVQCEQVEYSSWLGSLGSGLTLTMYISCCLCQFALGSQRKHPFLQDIMENKDDWSKNQEEENQELEDMEAGNHSSTHSSTQQDQPAAIPRPNFGSPTTKKMTLQDITYENMVGDIHSDILIHQFGSNSSLWDHSLTLTTSSHKQHSACRG